MTRPVLLWNLRDSWSEETWEPDNHGTLWVHMDGPSLRVGLVSEVPQYPENSGFYTVRYRVTVINAGGPPVVYTDERVDADPRVPHDPFNTAGEESRLTLPGWSVAGSPQVIYVVAYTMSGQNSSNRAVFVTTGADEMNPLNPRYMNASWFVEPNPDPPEGDTGTSLFWTGFVDSEEVTR